MIRSVTPSWATFRKRVQKRFTFSYIHIHFCVLTQYQRKTKTAFILFLVTFYACSASDLYLKKTIEETPKQKSKMPVQSLVEQAGLKIPVAALFFAYEHEGTVINNNFIQHVRIHTKLQHCNLRQMCSCNKNGDCLCYLFQIRHLMIDQYWNTQSDYIELGDWLTLTNRHRQL